MYRIAWMTITGFAGHGEMLYDTYEQAKYIADILNAGEAGRYCRHWAETIEKAKDKQEKET